MAHVTSIGLDVHARSVKGCAFNPFTGEVERKTFGYEPAEVASWILSFEAPKAVYESGVTGFHLQRELESLGVDCVIGAVSKMDKPAADKRKKTDRRDAAFLARQLALGTIVEDHAIEGFYEYVVPPLEGFWWQDGIEGVDYSNKSSFSWISVIRVPEFVSEADFAWAVEVATAKKKLDFSPVKLLEIDEGPCVQCMHVGTYDSEPATVDAMHAFAKEQGYEPDFSDVRRHHEIYLSDPRKADPAKMKTVVRHPIRKA